MSISNRQEMRLNQRETIFIEVHTSYPSSPANTKLLICNSLDLSANGIRAQIDEAVPINAIYQLCVEIHSSGEKLYLAAQVKWVRPAEDGQGFEVGLAIFESDDTDIEAWKRHIAAQLEP